MDRGLTISGKVESMMHSYNLPPSWKLTSVLITTSSASTASLISGLKSQQSPLRCSHVLWPSIINAPCPKLLNIRFVFSAAELRSSRGFQSFPIVQQKAIFWRKARRPVTAAIAFKAAFFGLHITTVLAQLLLLEEFKGSSSSCFMAAAITFLATRFQAAKKPYHIVQVMGSTRSCCQLFFNLPL